MSFRSLLYEVGRALSLSLVSDDRLCGLAHWTGEAGLKPTDRFISGIKLGLTRRQGASPRGRGTLIYRLHVSYLCGVIGLTSAFNFLIDFRRLNNIKKSNDAGVLIPLMFLQL